jgi:hypothetical protein
VTTATAIASLPQVTPYRRLSIDPTLRRFKAKAGHDPGLTAAQAAVPAPGENTEDPPELAGGDETIAVGERCREGIVPRIDEAAGVLVAAGFPPEPYNGRPRPTVGHDPWRGE